jgi:hypothetical protein
MCVLRVEVRALGDTIFRAASLIQYTSGLPVRETDRRWVLICLFNSRENLIRAVLPCSTTRVLTVTVLLFV